MYEKIVLLFIFTLLIIFMIIYKIKLNKVETFLNNNDNLLNNMNIKKNADDTILNAINCIDLEEEIKKKFNLFIKEFKSILSKYKLLNIFVLENSIKFNKNSINLNRNSVFIEFTYLKNNNNLFNDLLHLITNNESIRNKIKKEILNCIHFEGQLIYGIDFKNNSNRIYLNYKDNNEKYIIKGLQWSQNSDIFIKEYQHIENHNLVLKKLSKMFDINIVTKFLELFPVQSWDDACFKNDNSLTETDINSIQFAFKFTPKVNSMGLKLKDFIKLFYKNNNEKLIDNWLNCFKDTVITYIQIGKRNDNNELTIYTASFNNNFLDEINNQLFQLLNNTEIFN